MDKITSAKIHLVTPFARYEHEETAAFTVQLKKPTFPRRGLCSPWRFSPRPTLCPFGSSSEDFRGMIREISAIAERQGVDARRYRFRR